MKKRIEVYVNGALSGVSENDDLQWWHSAIVSAGLSCHLQLNITGPNSAELEINSGFGVDLSALIAVARALASVKAVKEPVGLKDVARAFEKAINAEPGVEVDMQRLDISTHGDPNRYRWQVAVTRTERKQVYP